MKLVPLEDRVIVKILEEEEKTSSGIVLPDTAKEKPQKATVLAVGPGRYMDDALIDRPQRRRSRVRQVRRH